MDENTVKSNHRGELKAEMRTKFSLSTDAYLIHSFNHGLLFCSRYDDFARTTNILRGKCKLFSRKMTIRIFGRIKKRSNDSILVPGIVFCRNCSNMDTSACTTLKQSTLAMSILATVSDADMWWHYIMAHPPCVLSKTWYGWANMEWNRSTSTPVGIYRLCSITHTKSPSNEGLIEKSKDISIHADVSELMQPITYEENKNFLALSDSHHKYVRVSLLKRPSQIAGHSF